eukprot:c4861_g1_i1.p1 GENE.c4861_g1_i1~~c4861_g1_i1.p1  ORF type:complete len:284 (+),score=54.14 c4861_g1_i1:59-910(+)
MSSRLFNATPKIQVFQEQLNNPYLPPADRHRLQKAALDVQKEYGIKQSHLFLPVLAQAPIFMSFFFGLRQLAHSEPSMMTGGLWFFTDLTTRDPTFVMPILSALGFVVTILITQNGKYALPQSPRMKLVVRSFSVFMVPLTAAFPKAMFVYWITNNGFSALQMCLFNISSVRRLLDIPEPNPEAVQMRKLQLEISATKKEQVGVWDRLAQQAREARAHADAAVAAEKEKMQQQQQQQIPAQAPVVDVNPSAPAKLVREGPRGKQQVVEVTTFAHRPKKTDKKQ